MRKKIAAAFLAIAFVALAVTPARASRYDDTEETHPLKVVGYAVHGAGEILSFVVFRPIHWIVSMPYLDVFFGHKAHANEAGCPFEYLHGDYSPSIAAEICVKKNHKDAAPAPATAPAKK